jgi:hypothetical protein
MERMVDEITISNEKVQMELEDVSLSDIHLDEDNPRIRYRLGLGTGQKTLDEVILAMPEVKGLRRDIKGTGGLRERVILQPNAKGYKVVEGNCRAACYRSLNAEDAADERWQKIPSRILPKDFDARKLAILLSDLHIAGKIAWGPHEKAGQVYRMCHDLHMRQEDVALHMRQSKSTVVRLYKAYEFMVETFFTVDGGKYADQGEGKWSWFDELFRSKDLKAILTSQPEFGEQFCRWVGEGRLPAGADVRKLAAIIRNPEAKWAFDEADPKKVNAVETAMKVVAAAEPEQGSDFFKLLAKLRDSCTNAAQVKEILKIRTDKTSRQRLLDTYEALVDFMRLADVDVPEARD